MKEYKISCIIPIYNVEKYIEECVESVINQTIFKDIEVILVNDGTLDSSAILCKKYVDTYENISLYNFENGGLGCARNRGVKVAAGEYLVFLDSDDYVLPRAYEIMYDVAKKNDSDLVSGGVQRFSNEGIRNHMGIHGNVIKDDIDKGNYKTIENICYDTTAWNKLIRRRFFVENNLSFPEKILYEDIPVSAKEHCLANNISIVSEIVYMWRIREGSITNTKGETRNFRDRFEIIKSTLAFLLEDDSRQAYVEGFMDKNLRLDLMYYINLFVDGNKDFQDAIMEELPEFVRKYENYILKYVSAKNKIKYFYIKNEDKEGLIHYLKNYETKNTYIIENSHLYYVDELVKDIPLEYRDNEAGIEPITSIAKAEWIDDSMLKLAGVAYLTELNAITKEDISYQAYAYNLETNEKISLEIEQSVQYANNAKYLKNSPKARVKLGYNLTDIRAASYALVIDFNKLKHDGVWKIMMVISSHGFTREISLRRPQRGKNSRPGYNISSKRYIEYLRYNSSWELTLNKYSFKDNYYDIENIEEDYLVINSNVDKRIKLYLENDKTKKILNIKDNKVDLTLLKDNENYRIVGKDENNYFVNVFFDYKDPDFSLVGKTIQLQCKKSQLGVLMVKKTEKACEVKTVKIENEKLIMELDFKDLDESQFVLYVSSNVHPGNIYFEKNGNKYEIDLFPSDKDGLLKGRWSFYYKRDDGNKVSINTLNNCQDYDSVEYTDIRNHNITIFRLTGGIYLQSQVIWPKIEKTVRRRHFIKDYLYPLFRKLPLNKKKIIFSSYWGASYKCNPRAIYEYITKEHPDYECIWLFEDEEMVINGKGKKIRNDSKEYFYHLATAKYFVNNVNFADNYIKRNGQEELQTLHGTFLKTMGFDVKSDVNTKEKYDGLRKRVSRWDYIIATSPYMEEKAKQSYLRDDIKVIRTGYPRNDRLFEDIDLDKLKHEMGIPLNKKVVFYAPTWRTTSNFDIKMDLDLMKEKLGDDYVLLFRLHHLVKKTVDFNAYYPFIIDMCDYQDINDLYLVSDVLITDYSSVMFDYAVTNKPMIFYTYDYEEYSNQTRGTYFELKDYACGPLVENEDDLLDAITNIGAYKEKYQDKYKVFKDKFTTYEDGKASKKVFETMISKKNR